ncbi:MAG: hypothetical protein HY390_05915 [Deltaproteobacteria bacterium]|nr:hypothetical protein [Deltaproteobacteria bacterium]
MYSSYKKLLVLGFGFYGAFTLLYTWPLILHLSSATLGDGDLPIDGMSVIWEFFWFKYGALSGHGFSDMYYINAPFGVDRTTMLTNYFWFYYGRVMGGERAIFSYNIALLLSFLFSGMTMSLLVHDLFHRLDLSLLAGFLFAFSPYHFSQAFERLGLASIQWLPLFVWALFRVSKYPTVKNSIFVSFCLALNFAVEPHYGIFCFMWLALFVLVMGIRFSKITRLGVKLFFWGGFCFLLFVLPFYFHAFKNFLNPPTTAEAKSLLAYERPLRDAELQSAKLLNYLLPAAIHPYGGKVTQKFLDTPFYGRSSLIQEHTLFLGYLCLFLFWLAWKRRKQMGEPDVFHLRFLFLAAFVFFLCSFPPYINLGVVKIPMPSLWIHAVLPPVRAFSRLAVMVQLSVIILSIYGVWTVLKNYSYRKQWGVMVFIFLIMAFEFLPVPAAKVVPIDLSVPSAYEWIGEQSGDFIIAEYPLSQFHKLYQLKHKKRLLNSDLHTVGTLRLHEELRDLTKPQTLEKLKQLGVRYILLHTEAYRQEVGDQGVQGQFPNLEHMPGLQGVQKFEDIWILQLK